MPVIVRRTRSWKDILINNLRDLNVYTAAFDDPVEIRRDQIVSTRVYLILLVFCMLALVNYTAFSPQTFSMKVNNPTFAEYEHLEAKYSSRLSCSCSKIAVSPGSFVNINVSFHQVCTHSFKQRRNVSIFSGMQILNKPLKRDFTEKTVVRNHL